MLEQKTKSRSCLSVGFSCFVSYYRQDAKQFVQIFLGNPQNAPLVEFLRGLGPNACLSAAIIIVGHKCMLKIVSNNKTAFVPPCLHFN